MRLSSETLLTILDEETLEKLERFCEGAIVVFNKRKIQHRHIRKDYERLTENGTMKIDALRLLAEQYNKSERQIRRIVNAEQNRQTS